MVFVEYGGGTGLQSLLARQSGIGTVIYNDISPSQCALAQEIAHELGLEADFYACGDIDTLVHLLETQQIKADIVTSYDVLEHVYDIDYFLGQFHTICNRGAVMVHCSGANMFWYPYVKHSTKMQEEVEKVGLQAFGIFHSSFLKDRISIIRKCSSGLSDAEIHLLATHTRGLFSRDIVEEVDRYLRTGQIPTLIDHPTNTCDPSDGNWYEHSMNPYYLAEVLASAGFSVKVLPKPFYRTDKRLVSFLGTLLNVLMRTSTDYMGLYFSPSYVIHATYTGMPSLKRHSQHMYHHSHLPIFYMVGTLYELLSLLYPRRGYYTNQWG
jgi:SAM-dependent methyltransferase